MYSMVDCGGNTCHPGAGPQVRAPRCGSPGAGPQVWVPRCGPGAAAWASPGAAGNAGAAPSDRLSQERSYGEAHGSCPVAASAAPLGRSRVLGRREEQEVRF